MGRWEKWEDWEKWEKWEKWEDGAEKKQNPIQIRQ
jgi:hypothetical protein